MYMVLGVFRVLGVCYMWCGDVELHLNTWY